MEQARVSKVDPVLMGIWAQVWGMGPENSLEAVRRLSRQCVLHGFIAGTVVTGVVLVLIQWSMRWK